MGSIGGNFRKAIECARSFLSAFFRFFPAMTSTPIAVHGASGRMGRRMIALASGVDLVVRAAYVRPESAERGRDAGELAGVGRTGIVVGPLGDLAQTGAKVVIEVSSPAGMRQAVAACRAAKANMVIGTTGLSADDQALLDEAAKDIAILQATSFSLVVNVMWKLAAEAARLLGPAYDIEVMETHHRFKKDAPSGTAMTLVQKLCEATGRDMEKDVVYTRAGHEATRKPNEITVQTLRLGDATGEHTAYFATLGERMEIKHVSTNRDSFVLGALRAAKWMDGKAPGRYTMGDVLGV